MSRQVSGSYTKIFGCIQLLTAILISSTNLPGANEAVGLGGAVAAEEGIEGAKVIVGDVAASSTLFSSSSSRTASSSASPPSPPPPSASSSSSGRTSWISRILISDVGAEEVGEGLEATPGVELEDDAEKAVEDDAPRAESST